MFFGFLIDALNAGWMERCPIEFVNICLHTPSIYAAFCAKYLVELHLCKMDTFFMYLWKNVIFETLLPPQTTTNPCKIWRAITLLLQEYDDRCTFLKFNGKISRFADPWIAPPISSNLLSKRYILQNVHPVLVKAWRNTQSYKISTRSDLNWSGRTSWNIGNNGDVCCRNPIAYRLLTRTKSSWDFYRSSKWRYGNIGI